jgi:hypothetical protein
MSLFPPSLPRRGLKPRSGLRTESCALRKTPYARTKLRYARAKLRAYIRHPSFPRRGLKPCGLENGVLLRKTPACIQHPSLPRRGKRPPAHFTPPPLRLHGRWRQVANGYSALIRIIFPLDIIRTTVLKYLNGFKADMHWLQCGKGRGRARRSV